MQDELRMVCAHGKSGKLGEEIAFEDAFKGNKYLANLSHPW